MQTYYFKGVVKGEEPLTVSVGGGGKGAHRLPRNGGYRSRPYMPATSVRGALRHACHLALNKHITSNGERLTLAQHFALAQGVDITKKDDSDETAIEEGVDTSAKLESFHAGAVDASVALRKSNPFISLWGRWGLSGHASVGNLYPINDDCVGEFGGGFRSVMFERNTDLIGYLESEEVSELEVMLQAQTDASQQVQPVKAQIKTLEKSLKSLDDNDAIEKVREKIAALKAQIEAIKTGKKAGTKESIRRPLENFEAFVAGCEFTHRMAVQAASDEELGLFLAGLQVFSRNPYLGGHRSHNCGKVSAMYEVSIYPDDVDKPIVIGTVSFGDEGFEISGEHLIAVRDAWKDANMDLSVW